MRTGTRRWRGLYPLALAPLFLGLTGCSVIDALNLQKPSAHVTGVRLQDIDLESVTMLFDVELKNPYSVPLPLVNLDYGLASKGKPFLSGEAPLQGTVPAMGSKTVSLPAKVTYKQLLSVLTDVKLGSVIPYRADLGLSVDAPAVGAMRLPLSKEGELPVPAPPEVQVQEIKWDDLSLDSAGGTVKLSVVNRNAFPVEMAKLAYGLKLGDVEVANTSIARPLAFAADGGAGVVEIPLSLSPRKLGLAVFRMLAGKGSGYTFTGDMNVKTPFGPMDLPVEKIGKTVFRK
jgi:LEA14-like dessication related protein